jgi:hypothetical protein
MNKYVVFYFKSGDYTEYKSLRDISKALKISYPLLTRLYRNDFKTDKHHNNIKTLIDNIGIFDIFTFQDFLNNYQNNKDDNKDNNDEL